MFSVEKNNRKKLQNSFQIYKKRDRMINVIIEQIINIVLSLIIYI